MTDANDAHNTSGGLTAHELKCLEAHGREVAYEVGETLMRRGQPGEALLVVVEGEVEVLRHTVDGSRLVLCRLGPGSTIGELSILTGEPASANVVAASPVKALAVKKANFEPAMDDCSSLRRKILARMATSLRRTTDDAWGQFKRAQALSALVDHDGGTDTMVATSAKTRSLSRRLQDAGTRRVPVLVTGEPGTGKTLAVRSIHQASVADGHRADVEIECRELDPKTAHMRIFGLVSGRDLLETSGCLGAIHMADGGSLILRHVDKLPADCQKELARLLTNDADTGKGPPLDTLLLATTRHPDQLESELRSAFTEVIDLPRVADRPKDILPLARRFLEDLADGNDLQLTQSAEHALLSLPYRSRNVDELRSVVELAIRCASGTEIRADHVFGGLGVAEPTGRAMGRPEWLLDLIRGPGLKWVRIAGLVGFVGAAVVCLTAGSTFFGRTANTVVWSAWEPLVFFLFLAAGPVWCTVCPLSVAGRLAQRVRSLGLPPPPRLIRTIGPWLGAVGFVVILWVEQLFHMTRTPQATAIMLLALIAASIALCLVYEREVWCRHICPLGRLATSLAPAAPLTVASEPSVCASTCITHECYRGSSSIPGCTVFHHPLTIAESHDCKLCTDCLASCPHGSTDIRLRLPLSGVKMLGRGSTYPVLFAGILAVSATLFLAAQRWPVFDSPLVLTIATVASIVLGAALARLMPSLAATTGRDSRDVVPRAACALAVLAWGPLMATQLGNIHRLGSIQLVAGSGVGLSLLTLLQITVIGLAVILSAFILMRLRARPPLAATWAAFGIAAFTLVLAG